MFKIEAFVLVCAMEIPEAWNILSDGHLAFLKRWDVSQPLLAAWSPKRQESGHTSSSCLTQWPPLIMYATTTVSFFFPFRSMRRRKGAEMTGQLKLLSVLKGGQRKGECLMVYH